MKDFASELKRGTLELILLRLLADRPAYGYELLQRMQEAGTAVLKEGTIYPVLYRLEDRGWIAPEWQAPEPGTPRKGLPRKYYRLTPTGQARLRELRAEWRAFAAWVDALLHDEENDDEGSR